MEITKMDANAILWWATVAKQESLLTDETNLIERIKIAFPEIHTPLLNHPK